MKKVYLDAGHGGNDSGAVGVDGVLEKDIVLYVVKEISNILRGRGVDVRLSRTDDTFKSLSFRSDDANKWGADAFISIHCNSAGKSAKGLETFCYKFKYRKLADCVQNKIISDKLYIYNRGVKEGDLHVVRETNMPACLVELGFISNKEDKEFVVTNKDKMALSIANGICDFLGVKYDNNPIEDTSRYVIVTGGFGNKENAQQNLNCLAKLTGWYLELEEFTPGDFRMRTGWFEGEEEVRKMLSALKTLTNWWCSYEKLI